MQNIVALVTIRVTDTCDAGSHRSAHVCWCLVDSKLLEAIWSSTLGRKAMAATHEAGDDCKRAHSSRHFLTERTVKGLPMQVKHGPGSDAGGAGEWPIWGHPRPGCVVHTRFVALQGLRCVQTFPVRVHTHSALTC